MARSVPEITVSDRLRQIVAELGPAAEAWLGQVPSHLASITEAWELTLDPQLDHVGMNSIVFPATTADGEATILKLTVPHDDAIGAVSALRRWGGVGAVRLLRSSDDGFTLLLERCLPGHDLWTLPFDDQLEVVADLLPRLWVEPDRGAPIRELDDTVAAWERRMRADPASCDAPAEVVARAAQWAAELGSGSQRRVVLHGDLNPGNVLAAERGPWLAIDPSGGWAGDPAFDLGQMLLNWVWPDDAPRDLVVERTVRRATQLADRLDLDVVRVLRWATVKAIGWDAARDDITVLDDAARSVGGDDRS